jgi:hypothetical protein
MIETFFTLTEAEYVECQRLYLRQRPKRSRRWDLLLCVIFLIGIFILVRTRQSAWDALIFVIIGGIGGAALGFVMKEVLQARSFKRRFETASRMLTDAHLSFDDSGIRSKIDGIGEGKTEWNACTSWLEGKNVLLILYGHSFSPIPKRALSEESKQELRDLLSRKIAGVGGAREL